jgi:hypothetical protein
VYKGMIEVAQFKRVRAEIEDIHAELSMSTSRTEGALHDRVTLDVFMNLLRRKTVVSELLRIVLGKDNPAASRMIVECILKASNLPPGISEC